MVVEAGVVVEVMALSWAASFPGMLWCLPFGAPLHVRQFLLMVRFYVVLPCR